jgi:MFS transporter, ACS family, glucarate transporter
MGIIASVPLLAGVAGDLCGGLFSDLLFKRTRNLGFARRTVAVSGFILAAITIPWAVRTPNIELSAALFSAAVFGLELTVGNSWAVTLDVGGEFAGSVSAVMNTFGNLAGALGSAITGYVITFLGWDSVFFVLAALAALGAILFSGINASKPFCAADDAW